MGLKDGDLVRLGNKRGNVVVHVKLVRGSQLDVIVVEGIWPNKAFVENIGINSLIGSEPGLPAGGAAFHDTAIWMLPA